MSILLRHLQALFRYLQEVKKLFRHLLYCNLIGQNVTTMVQVHVGVIDNYTFYLAYLFVQKGHFLFRGTKSSLQCSRQHLVPPSIIFSLLYYRGDLVSHTVIYSLQYNRGDLVHSALMLPHNYRGDLVTRALNLPCIW